MQICSDTVQLQLGENQSHPVETKAASQFPTRHERNVLYVTRTEKTRTTYTQIAATVAAGGGYVHSSYVHAVRSKQRM